MSIFRKRITFGITLLLALTAITACSQNEKLRIGTAGEGGNYNSLGQALSDRLGDDPYDLSTEVKTTAGSTANIRLLSKDYLELAFAQSDVIDEMYNGTLETAAMQGYGAVAALYPEPVQIIVRSDAKIKSVSDLAGKTVSVGEEDSGTKKNAAHILNSYGLTSDMLTVQNLTYQEASEALADGKIDAMFCTAGAPADVVTDLADKTSVTLLPIDKEKSDLLMKAYGFYKDTVIPAGTYTGQTEDVPTLAVQSVLLASDKVSEETVHTITQALFAEQEKLNDIVPFELAFREEDAVETVTIPFHPGAAAYYEENGITVDTSAK